MVKDCEGFHYPFVDADSCIDCGLCEKVCPMLTQGEQRVPLYTYAAKCTDENIRLKSSSGGLFTLLATETLNRGGVVFGARFNEQWEVVHDYCTTVEGLEAFRGSKYVQSRIGDTLSKAEKFLKEGREVLFSGTPCQISGLKRFLRREYDNLLTVEVACHGVPSPLVWMRYIEELQLSSQEIKNVAFRDKSTGWANYSFKLDSDRGGVCERFYDNVYMKAFLINVSLRPSCYNCPAKEHKSGADIMLADLWGASKVIGCDDDDKGVSLVVVNKENILPADKLWLKSIDYQQAIKYNSAIVKSVPLTDKRIVFFAKFANRERLSSIVAEITRVPTIRKVLSLVKRVIKKIIGRK